jgi:DNA (cytosine-5)-methyltransferase 1
MRTDFIPVIDLFPRLGGLGEGFASLNSSSGDPIFRVALSIKKEEAAHQTLSLR